MSVLLLFINAKFSEFFNCALVNVVILNLSSPISCLKFSSDLSSNKLISYSAYSVKQQDIMGFGAAQKPVDSSRVTPADLADSEVNSRKSSFSRTLFAPPKQWRSSFLIAQRKLPALISKQNKIFNAVLFWCVWRRCCWPKRSGTVVTRVATALAAVPVVTRTASRRRSPPTDKSPPTRAPRLIRWCRTSQVATHNSMQLVFNFLSLAWGLKLFVLDEIFC